MANGVRLNMPQSNDLTWIINEFSFIENLMDQIISNFTSPRKDAHFFFWQVILDSSVISVGSKVKVMMAISQECGIKINPDPIHKLLSIRNAFAHSKTNSHPCMVVGKTPEQNEMHYYLHTLSNSGQIKKVKRTEAVEEFNKLYGKAKEQLLELVAKTKDM